MSTFFLNRKLSGICGNILIMVDDQTVKLTSALSESSLSDHQYKEVLINPDSDYSSDVYKIFGNIENTVLFSGDDFEVIENRIITTLVVDESMPDRFVIMSKNGSEDCNDHTVKKSYDLTENSKLGRYLRNHLSNENIKYNPIDIDFENKVVSINGIDLSSGSIISKNDAYETVDDDSLTSSFLNNNIIPSTIFQFSFLIEDLEEDDYWMFIDEVKLGDFLEETHNDDFVPTVFGASVGGGNTKITDFEGIILNDSNDIPYHYCKSDNKLSSSTPIANGELTITDKLLSKFIVKKDIKLDVIKDYTRLIVLKLNSSSQQNDKLEFVLKTGSIILVADYLPNHPNFGATDNERYVFNPNGTIDEQCESISNAFNYMTENAHSYVAKPYGDHIVISSTNEFLPFDMKTIITNIDLEIVHDTELPVSNDLITSIIDIDDLDSVKGSFFKSKVGYHRVKSDMPYVDVQLIDDVFTLVDIDNKIVVGAEKDYNGEVDIERVWEREKVEYGVFSVYPVSELTTDILVGSSNITEDSKKYDAQDKLIIGEEYRVIATIPDSSINHDGVVYGLVPIPFVRTAITGDTFIATSENFEVLSGDPKVYVLSYWLDNEAELFRDSVLQDISDVTVVQNDVNWAIKDATGITDDKIFLTGSSTPDFDTKDAENKLFTHSWYYISNLLSGEFNETTFKNTSYDYFLEYFDDKYSNIILNEKFDVSETIFKGVKLKFDLKYDGYKFSVLLNTKNILETYETTDHPVEVKLLKNETYNTAVLLVDFSVSDWKAVDDFGNTTVDYAYLHMMLGIKKHLGSGVFDFGDEFQYPPVPNITYQDGIGNPTDKFRGIKLQNKYDILANPTPNSMEFIGNISKVSNWVKQDSGDFGGIVGIDYNKTSIVTSFVNIAPAGFFEHGDSLPFDVADNTIRFTDDQIFALAINGTVVNSILPFSYLKGFEDLRGYQWYQVSDVTKCYETIKKVLSFSNIKDIISQRDEGATIEIDENINFVRPNIDFNKYSDRYVISNKSISNINGDEIYDNWLTHYKTWEEEEDKTWITVSPFTRLGLVLNREEININKE